MSGGTLAQMNAAPEWENCGPLDTLGKYPRAVFRLTFVPQNIFFPDRLSLTLGVPGDWPATLQVQLDKLGAESPVMPIQGQPTALDTIATGRVGSFDVMARSAFAADSLQSAMNAVESSYGYCKVIRVKRLPPPSRETDAQWTDQQKQDAESAGTKYEDQGPLSRLDDFLDSLLWLAASVAVIYVISKLPNAPQTPTK